MNYYHNTHGVIVGPLSAEEIRTGLQTGAISSTAQVRGEEGSQWVPIERLFNIGASPPPFPVRAQTGDSTGGLIPYKNPQALIAYYLAIFGLIPGLGLLVAPAAFVLGILGLKARKANPVVSGTVHAWIGIILGGLVCLVYLAGILFILLK